MKKQINYSKILLVIFITILVWIWTDKRLDSDYTVPNATIKLDRAAAGDIYVLFGDKPEASIENIRLVGPASRIDDIKRDIQTGRLKRDFFFIPREERMTEPGHYKLEVLDFIRKNNLLKNLGVTAEYCEPNSINVEIIKLEKKLLTVKCTRENGSEINTKSIDPPKVTMMVPQDWSRERLVAHVILTDSEIDQARVSPVKATPFIDFPPGSETKAEREVKITISAETEDLKDYTITGATVGYVFSSNLQGKYEVKLSNLADFATINIQASQAAYEAYNSEEYKVLLKILDSDKDATTEQKREVVYNFPAEFIRDGKIKLTGKPIEARFTIVQITPEKPALTVNQ